MKAFNQIFKFTELIISLFLKIIHYLFIIIIYLRLIINLLKFSINYFIFILVNYEFKEFQLKKINLIIFTIILMKFFLN